MNQLRYRLILVLAAIGLCAMAYGAWRYYQGAKAADATRSYFSAPYSGDTFRSPAPPPPQPHP